MPMTDRPGMPNSDEADIDTSVADTIVTVLQTRDDTLFEPNQLIAELPSGAVETTIEIYDEPDGTALADLNDLRKTIRALQGGEVRAYDDLSMRDFETDVVARVLVAGDSTAEVFVDGKEITGTGGV